MDQDQNDDEDLPRRFRMIPRKRRIFESPNPPFRIQSVATQPTQQNQQTQSTQPTTMTDNLLNQLSQPPNKKQRINFMKRLFVLLMSEYDELNHMY